jgi:amidase
LVEIVEEIARHRPPDASSTDPFVIGPFHLDGGSAGQLLSGLRFAVKDLYDVAGTRTGVGNPARLVDAPVQPSHSPSVAALIDAGAELVGKTVTDELAFSLSGTNIHYGTPENPAAPGRVPGGSSSGSVSCVAAGTVDFALGTDTGGSTRVPASYCGVYGLRATHGRVSREGVFILAPSFCSLGVFARSADVLAQVWTVLEQLSTETSADVARSPRRLIVLPELFALADDDASQVLLDAARGLAGRVDLPLDVIESSPIGSPRELFEVFRTIQMYEAWELHGSWVDEHHGSLGWGIAARFEQAATVSSSSVALARRRRAQFQNDLRELLGFDGYLLQPAASGPAPLISLASEEKDDLRLRTMMLTAPAGLSGSPVVSMPLAMVEGLPMGLCIVGLPGDDSAVIDLVVGGCR